MSLMTAILGAMIGALAYAGIYHAVAGYAWRDYGKHLALSLVCLLFSFFIGSRIYELTLSDLDDYVRVHKLGVACSMASLPLLLRFVVRRVKWQSPIGYWLLAVPALVFILANFLLPYGLQYQALTGLAEHRLPWGETLVSVEGKLSLWMPIVGLWMTLVIGVMTYLTLRFWWSTRRWLDALVALAFCFYFLINSQGMLARLGLIETMPMGVLGVPLVIAAISILYIYQERRERYDHAQHLEWLTAHDEKTGLPNRSHLLSKLAERPPMVLAMFGLDNLGRINEAFGHEQGDQVIKTIAQRLIGFLQSDEIGARFEGDHFVFASPQQERVMALHRLIQEPVDLGQGLVVEISAGMGYLPTDLVRVPTKVLQQALQQMYQWMADGLPLGRVAVNISMHQLARVDFVASVLAQLQASGVNPAQLELEITESAAMENLEFVLASLQQLAEAGVTLAMDDFGTGYSSLSYLQKLPFHIIKIDMSFVRRLGTPEGDELVHGMMTLIRNLKRDMVAEGIETLEQLEWLRAEGCTEGQGYYLSKPLSVVDATAWLASHR